MFTCKNRCRYSQRRATFCQQTGNMLAKSCRRGAGDQRQSALRPPARRWTEPKRSTYSDTNFMPYHFVFFFFLFSFSFFFFFFFFFLPLRQHRQKQQKFNFRQFVIGFDKAKCGSFLSSGSFLSMFEALHKDLERYLELSNLLALLATCC